MIRPRPGATLGLPADAVVLAFVGRIQPLKAPDLLIRAAARMLERDPSLRERLIVAIIGGPSGNGMEHPESHAELARALGVDDVTRFVKPMERPGWRTGTEPLRLSAFRRTRNPSGWSRWRRRPAVRRWSRRRSAA